ncbi:CACTA en-spm transposon protein [Cucumis melo var. makuwa]|uniref:CACTA en-spm transposon protein n=1 Tax=Cucumis melo var. makuwa TaxID=1194695 RepID=A0A5A7T4E3_CUCMM|nr:CACTA en-spm transposon protein [Cucumis melo var. makuwa]TYJ97064.1 CACTA en-spm transposon protein [Cucumis melo var. makuwa]
MSSITQEDHPLWVTLQEQSRMNNATRQKQPYNHSSESKLFLQRQHELAEEQGQPVGHVQLFRETHARSGQFILQAAADAYNQMLEIRSYPTPKGSQRWRKRN